MLWQDSRRTNRGGGVKSTNFFFPLPNSASKRGGGGGGGSEHFLPGLGARLPFFLSKKGDFYFFLDQPVPPAPPPGSATGVYRNLQ